MQNINKTRLSLGSLFRTITLFLTLFLFNQSVALAQCDPGSPNCATSDVIDFPFNTRMLSEINGGGEIPGCNGQGFFHNTTWYRIIPTSPFIFIDITSSNCTTQGGNQGIQLGLYPACDPNSEPVGAIQCDCAAPGQTITLGGVVTPGVPYFIMVDGCSGSTCNLNMVLTTGAVQSPTVNLGEPGQPTTFDPIPTCPGAELTFTIPPVNDADIYTWNFPPGTTIVSQDCNTATVIWGPVGGDVNVNVTNVTNGQTNVGPPLNVPIDPPMYSLTRDYCSPEALGYTFYGDGITYSQGMYSILVPGPLCDTLVTLTVVENLISVANIISLPTTCNSSQDNYFENGQATIFMQNTGGGPYSYVWENSNVTGPTNNQLPVGSTGVTITDVSTGCELEEFVFIDEPQYLFADVNVDVAPSCGTAADGEMVVFTQGGTSMTGNYTYAWMGPNGYTSSQMNPTDVAAGVHELLITDDNGCEFLWIGNIVASGGNVTATESNLSGESCAGANNGSVTLTGDGPGTFTFTWPGPIVAATRNDLAAGSYDVTIENGSGCTGIQTVTIAPGSSFTVDASATSDVRCFGESNGSVTVDVAGASGTLMYNLGSGTVAGNVISDLPAGNYTLTVTDAAGCTSGDIPVVIGTPTEFLPTIANTPVTCGGNGDGTATVTPNGGTGPYTYLWGDGEVTSSIGSLSGGTFTVVVMDDNGCSVPLSTDVDGGGSLGVLTDPANTQLMVSCPGAADGSVTVNVTGATGTITYVWTGNTTSTSATASGLEPGMYTVVAQDAAGCSSAPFPVEITAPSPIVVMEVGTTQTSCEAGTDGSAEVSVSGGTGTNYTFEWDNLETTNPAVGLTPGPHTVTVRDENNCPQTLNVTIAEPVAITAIIDPVNESCADEDDGTLTINAMGGSGSYLYDIGDGNGPQASNVFTNLEPNTYSVIVTNADGSCAETVTATVMDQALITAVVTPTDVSCAGANDGEATVTPNGGVGPYTFLWTDGEVSQTITTKSGGGYFVTVTDANMCSEIFPTAIGESTPIVVTLNNQTPANCDGSGGATASINVNGGDGNYSYTWSAGTPNDDQVSDLNAGIVTVVVEDGANCTSTPFDIDITAPDPVVLTEDQLTAETCFNEEDGEVTVMTNGGTGPFEFSLDGGPTQNSNEFTDIAPGNHTVEVTDASGCTDLININIPAAAEIVGSVDAVSDLVVCDGATDGSITITASGGDGNLMYQLGNDTPQASNVFNNLGGGNFTITVIDGNTCSIPVTVDVTELSPINLDVDLANSELTICDSATDGVVTIDANGGDNNFTYTLGTDTQPSNEFTGLTGGNYTVQVTDGNGCTNDVDFTVTELAPITIDLDAVASDLIVCTGASDGNVTLNANGGDNNLTYSIPGFTPNSNGEFDNLTPNDYTVTVTDGNMCSETFDFTVTPAPAITAQVDVAASDLALCNDDTDGSVTIDANGGDGSFMYTLNGITQASPVFNNLGADVYTGMVEDGNGCSEPISVTVTEADEIVANITVSDLLVCNGFTDGSVTITTTGGDDNFTYNIDGNNQASNVFNDLAPGPHTVMITDGSGCTTAPVDFTVTEGAEISANIDAAASEQLVCDGFTDGSVTIMASGGTGGLMYSIDNINFQASNEFTGLGEGSYTVTIMDADGCSPTPVPVTIDAATPVTGVIDPISTLSICDGETIGSITVNGSGGTGDLTYTLNPGNISQTTNIFNDLPAGNYTIDIEDENACTTTPIAVEVEEAPALTAAVDPNSDLINCFGETDGSITINAAGGNGGLMYDIVGDGINPQASNIFTDLAPGVYSIIVTDANDCPSTPVDITVTEAADLAAELTLASSDLTVCSGAADATVAFEATGGDGNYMYALGNNPAQAGNTFNDLGEGDYTVTVIDGNGCTQPVSFTVAPAPAITYTSDIVNVGCFGQAEGQITISMIAGDGPFDFAWSNSQVTEVAQQLPAGLQTVTITDANMCEVIETFTITQPADALSIDNTAMIQPATCGDTNGSVSITVNGGTAPYSYAWNNDTTNPDLTNVGPGSFDVTVTDANMCEIISPSYSVNEPGALGVDPTATPVGCNGDQTGAISLFVEGGTTPYTFEWTDDAAETMADRTNLSAGTYTVIVSDGDGCILPELSVTVSQPEPLTTTLTPTQASCGTSDGSVSLLVEGGTGVGTYSYAWFGGSTDANLTNVPAGTYDVTVTDQNMCTFVSEIATVTNPGTPELTIDGEDVTCFGASTGTITLGITGGSGGNTVTWNVPSLNGLTNPTNLPAGDYIATVVDNSMCSSSIMFTIDEPAAPLEITEIQVNQATCGNSNGSVTVEIAGGTGNYTYDWSSGTGTSTVSGLSPGIVELVITDQNMCTATASYNVSEPDALQVDINTTTVVDATCNGTSTGSIDVSVIGGTGPGTYTYAWADGFGANEDLTNLPAGTYTLLITDGVGCEFTYETTIDEPELLTAISTPVMANCGENNGAINITVSGGSGPGTYDFLWDDAAATTSEDLNNVPADSYSVTITDANNCEFILTDDVENPNPPVVGIVATDAACNNTATGSAVIDVTGGSGIYTYTWSDPAFTGQDNPTTLPAGDYTVTVSDNLNCSAVETLTIGEPTALVLNIEEVVQATCGEDNGSVAISIEGGTMPYTYNWSNGATSEDLQNLTPGDYELNFMDANGCTLSESFQVSEPNALTVVEGSINQVDCSGGNNGSIQITAEGGSGPGTYTYLWSTGDTDDSIDNLTAGTYTLIVTDTNDCSFEYSETITEPAPIMITGTTTDAVCGEANGSINLTVTGGTGNSDDFIYAWDNGAAGVPDPGNLPAGQYNVTITDQNNCVAEPFSIAVTSPNAPQIEVASASITCNGANDGSIDLTVTGGTGEVTITWSDPAFTGTSVNDLPPGVYEITAEDEVGCTFPVNVTITEPQLLEAFVIDPQSSTLCNGSSDGSIELTVQGGTGTNYTYLWTNGAPNVQNPDNLTAGLYEVTVTDENGCTTTESVTIVEPDAITLTADASPASCSNTIDGSIEVSVNGGTGDYTYEWNGGQITDANPTNLQPGTYTLVVSDQNSCNGTITVTVDAPAPVTIDLAEVSDYNGFNTSCSESEDGFITVSAEGGNSGYSYAWADGTDGPTIADIGQGSYSVIVTDQEGCTGQNNFSLDGPAPITLDVETDEPECFGENNGVIIINGVEGGRLPYRYSLNNGDYTSAQFFGNLGSGTYSLLVEDANGCTNDTDVIVDEVNQVTVSLSDEPVINITLGDSITLAPQTNIVLTDSTYAWALGFDGDTLQGLRPVVRPFNTTSYSISVTDEFGCTATDEVLVQVTKPRLIYIPNAFNPNSVNGNNLFTIHGGQDVSIVRSLEIFNRWGEIVYADKDFPTDTPSRGSWNGFFRSKEAQSGVYVYIINVDFIDGHSETYSGDITLLR